jgi:hypothetical protein
MAAGDDQWGLVLELRWSGDRYGQSIFAVQAGVATLIAQSRESKAGDGDSRPTFQELSIEHFGDREAIFLVGMSGKEYWSASIEPSSGDCGFVFDLSCKGALAPRCEYASTSGAAEEALLVGKSRAGDFRYLVEPVEHSDFETRVQQGGEGIEIVSESKIPRAPSVRWKYRWRLRRNPEFA